MRQPWPDSPYYVLVSRQTRYGECLVYPSFATKPLPTIPIHLNDEVADVSIDLQSIFDDVLTYSRYESSMKYYEPIDPPLSQEEAELLRHAL